MRTICKQLVLRAGWRHPIDKAPYLASEFPLALVIEHLRHDLYFCQPASAE